MLEDFGSKQCERDGCEEWFPIRHSDSRTRKYHNLSCAHKAIGEQTKGRHEEKNRIWVPCLSCGEEVDITDVPESAREKRSGFFCSDVCEDEHIRGPLLECSRVHCEERYRVLEGNFMFCSKECDLLHRVENSLPEFKEKHVKGTAGWL